MIAPLEDLVLKWRQNGSRWLPTCSAVYSRVVRRTTKADVKVGAVPLIVVACAACSSGGDQMNDAIRSQVVAAVQQRMRSFEAAERALDVETLLSHFSSSRDFYMYNDGQRVTYAVMSEGVRTVFPTLRAIDGGFEGLEILPLATDAALATARFRETITDIGGKQTVQHGVASWLWRHEDGEWRIAYGHVDHRPGDSQ